MGSSSNIDHSLLKQWNLNSLEPQALADQLVSQGYDSETVNAYVDAYKKFKVARKQFMGFFCMGLGAFLGFVSCVLTLVNPIPELYNVILFGLTSIAILIIVVGMYFLFE
jgi:hypothetical protein